MKTERWYARDAVTGRLLGMVLGGDIDRALAIARARWYHAVTVDNMSPRPEELADPVIRQP